jgi:hypothetical protein
VQDVSDTRGARHRSAVQRALIRSTMPSGQLAEKSESR